MFKLLILTLTDRPIQTHRCSIYSCRISSRVLLHRRRLVRNSQQICQPPWPRRRHHLPAHRHHQQHYLCERRHGWMDHHDPDLTLFDFSLELKLVIEIDSEFFRYIDFFFLKNSGCYPFPNPISQTGDWFFSYHLLIQSSLYLILGKILIQSCLVYQTGP